MLSAKTIEIVKSTVPVLEKHGEEITKRFYATMLNAHPELLNIFNHTNQKIGRQQSALANAVYAFAVFIDQLEKIMPDVKLIAHKHRSLGIKPEHYPIVGKYLILAIKDVLKDAATDEIIQAWTEAYGVLADTFISIEKEMYEEAESKEGGWRDFKEFYVANKIKESDVITSFYLKPKDGSKVASFLPGQYISVRVKTPGSEYTQIRQYSLSDAPNGEYYRISVKREAEEQKQKGIVSNFLHDFVNEGDTIEVSVPAGDFVLNMENKKPLVLISGGVGITPLMSMLKVASKEQPERDITFIHAARNGRYHALREETSSLGAKVLFCYSDPTEEDIASQSFDKEGYITSEWLQEVIENKDADYYICGPVPFMKATYQALQDIGVKEEAIHYEFFGPSMKL
ncbi:NO-inducible flavohemoprotein [Bacillus methanolicus]|uniref:NO-inducible flavohemoprotein n=1 Tax=Bacillus methanolicus TaxID=1471 RepID=UPI00237FF3F0|nr:NO-inducible flavohemoprotein [Bacillus methanolicus]MDE3839482.1 NO-inducible flavohemoprotein [Bacillus methanolicus]